MILEALKWSFSLPWPLTDVWPYVSLSAAEHDEPTNAHFDFSISLYHWSHLFIVPIGFCDKFVLYGPGLLESFYCDVIQHIRLDCTETYKLVFMVTANSGFISMATFFLLILSYFHHGHSSETLLKSLSIFLDLVNCGGFILWSTDLSGLLLQHMWINF